MTRSAPSLALDLPLTWRRSARALLALTTAAGLALTLAGRLGRLAWWLDLWSHFPLQLATGLGLCALAAAALRAPRLALLAVLGTTINLALLAPAYATTGPSTPSTSPPSASTTPSQTPYAAPSRPSPLRILSFNVLTMNRNKAEVMAYVLDRQPDLLALIETDQRWLEAARQLPGYTIVEAAPRPDNFGLLLARRLDRSDLTVADARSSESLAGDWRPVPHIEADLALAGRPFHLLVLHTMPPKGPRASAMRDHQLAGATAWAARQPAPALVLGDFNTTPFSSGYAALLRQHQLHDSYRGHGWQATWPLAPIPLLGIPIDHAIHTAGIEAPSRHIGPSLGSDHRALELEIHLRE